MTTTEMIDNYPGFPQGITGSDLSTAMEEQAKRFGMEGVNQELTEVKLGELNHRVRTSEAEYVGKTLIICTGAEYRMLGVPGEREFRGKGVSYCATCDAPFFQDRPIAVVGGGDSAITEALYLAK
jgi:thioredoxin reductase (NADPH)